MRSYDGKTQNKNVKVNLGSGKVWANVKKLVTADSRVEVKTVNAVVVENRSNERRTEGLILSISEDGQNWEEIWRAKTWESTWLVPVTHFDAGINAPGRRARFIRVETKNEVPRELLLKRITVFGVQ